MSHHLSKRNLNTALLVGQILVGAPPLLLSLQQLQTLTLECLKLTTNVRSMLSQPQGNSNMTTSVQDVTTWMDQTDIVAILELLQAFVYDLTLVLHSNNSHQGMHPLPETVVKGCNLLADGLDRLKRSIQSIPDKILRSKTHLPASTFWWFAWPWSSRSSTHASSINFTVELEQMKSDLERVQTRYTWFARSVSTIYRCSSSHMLLPQRNK